MEAERRINRSTRFRLAPAATRRLGSDLLVNAGGATASVQRLMGTGPELWECFAGPQRRPEGHRPPRASGRDA